MTTKNQKSKSIRKEEIPKKLNCTPKPHKSEKWEIDVIGDFLLKLYHQRVLTSQNKWMIPKRTIRQKFEEFLCPELKARFIELNGTDNIGTLLYRCGFLRHTPRGCENYQIQHLPLFRHRNRKLDEYDDKQINTNFTVIIGDSPKNLSETKLPNLDDEGSLDIDTQKFQLVYEATGFQKRNEDFRDTSTGCYICQCDFSRMCDFEKHVESHVENFNFGQLLFMKKLNEPIFELTYSLCNNSHLLYFTLTSDIKGLVVEKIIILREQSMYCVENMSLPYDLAGSGCKSFLVDSHLLGVRVEQPIVVVAHYRENRNERIVEQHCFMRNEELPKVQLDTRPYHIPSTRQFVAKYKLKKYFPSATVRLGLECGYSFAENGEKHNFYSALDQLLQMEDLVKIETFLKFVMVQVKIHMFEGYYSLKVEDDSFIESTVTSCDKVLITPHTVTNRMELIRLLETEPKKILGDRKVHVGYIESISGSRVTFKCVRNINIDRLYTVLFVPERSFICYQYYALERLRSEKMFLRMILFPSVLERRLLNNCSLDLFNKTIEDNPEQLQAVRNIAEGPRKDAIYIIFGPPGTGKTTTVVEAILQVIVRRPDTWVLVTASSNSACDEVAVRLCRALSSRSDIRNALARIYARSSEARADRVDELLLKYSNIYCGHFYPAVEVLHMYRIVVCTPAVVGRLATGGFGGSAAGGHFTHLFIDEVATLTEPEALTAIVSILSSTSHLIISGDHKQLGPVLLSKAEQLGLGFSLMERLLAFDCYRVRADTGEYDRTIQTRLCRNYRSHPEIVRLYSTMYYDASLKPMADIESVSLGRAWHRSPNVNFPIIFHSVKGYSQRDEGSSSIYNLAEVRVVMDYVKDLMYFGINGHKIGETDIGIISPYKKQYQYIQKELDSRKWFGIETGSVETFQGREKSIIIVSFVRSGMKTLGFLNSPRRLNVTISRAKSLLILIGNANTLSMNDDIKYVINECREHNTFVGYKDECEIVKLQPEDGSDQVNELNKSMRTLSIDGSSENLGTKLTSHHQNDNNKMERKENKSSAAAISKNLSNIPSLDTLFKQLPTVPVVQTSLAAAATTAGVRKPIATVSPTSSTSSSTATRQTVNCTAVSNSTISTKPKAPMPPAVASASSSTSTATRLTTTNYGHTTVNQRLPTKSSAAISGSSAGFLRTPSIDPAYSSERFGFSTYGQSTFSSSSSVSHSYDRNRQWNGSIENQSQYPKKRKSNCTIL